MLPTVTPMPPASLVERMLCDRCLPLVRALEQPFRGYCLLREEYRDGSDQVYRAALETNGARLTLETMLVPLHDLRTSAFFHRKTALLRRLRHPAIPAVMNDGEADGRPYLVREFVRGRRADEWLREGSPLEAPRVVRWVAEALGALAHVHAEGFVHLDVKPKWLFVTRAGSVQLNGFFIAHRFAPPDPDDSDVMRGTPLFMAPEVLRGDLTRVGPATDLYSTGVTLYHLLTNAFPQEGDARDYAAIMRGTVEGEPVPLRSRRPDVAPGLAQVVHRALRKDPAERYADAQAMRRALLPFAE
jgi:serine/threonine protein kinase